MLDPKVERLLQRSMYGDLTTHHNATLDMIAADLLLDVLGLYPMSEWQAAVELLKMNVDSRIKGKRRSQSRQAA